MGVCGGYAGCTRSFKPPQRRALEKLFDAARTLSAGITRSAPQHAVFPRSWLYRVRPAVMHTKFVPAEAGLASGSILPNFSGATLDPNQMR